MSPAVGVVPLEGRGSLPFVDLHDEPMFLHAVRTLRAVDALEHRVVVTVDPEQSSLAMSDLRRYAVSARVEAAADWWRSGHRGTVVLHDPLCPLVPVGFVARTLELASTGEGALISYRPVTDTIKTVVDDRIVDTVDRTEFAIVTSPVVFVTDGVGTPPTEDFAELAGWLRTRGQVAMRKAPSMGRRVDDASAVNLLECMDQMSRTLRER